MPSVDFETVSEELDEANGLMFMCAMVRRSLLHGADNVPSLVILTDKAIFWGGSESGGGRFQRVPLNGITKAAKAGKAVWECVEVRHMEIDGEKTVYICPFTGPPQKPKKDTESMDVLLAHLRGGRA